MCCGDKWLIMGLRVFKVFKDSKDSKVFRDPEDGKSLLFPAAAFAHQRAFGGRK